MTDQDKKANILVVDDDSTLRDLLSLTLEASGYRVTTAAGGVEALVKLNDETFDLMITDIKMPDIDGLQLFKKVKRHYSDMPVLFITGVVSEEILGSSAANGFLAKPFRISRMEELIKETLVNKARSSSARARHILIADRDPHLRDYLSEMLSQADYIPFTVSQASEALRELNNGEFEVLIIEAKLPDLDIMTMLRGISGSHTGLPVILTGELSTDQISEIDGIHAAIVGHLKKPFKSSEILSLLDKITPVMK